MTAGTATTAPVTTGRKIAILALAILVPLVIMALAAEGLLRFFGTRSPVIHADMLIQRQDPRWPYALRPGYRGTYGGGEVTIGADGNRVVPLPAGGGEAAERPRVIILGDSVAFGQGVDDGGTIAAQMQSDGGWGPAHRAVLMAAPGYTSWNEYAALRAADLADVRTVVLIYVGNDITTENDRFKLANANGRMVDMERDAFHKFTRFLYDHSRLFYVITDSIKKLGAGLQTGAGEEAAASARPSVDAKGLAYSMEAIAGIRDLCRERGINLVVAIYNDGDRYARPAWTAAYNEAVAASLTALGVDYFVPHAARDQLTARQFAVAWNDSRHLSPAASAITAREIIAELARRGF
jgi:hypothetical protein